MLGCLQQLLADQSPGHTGIPERHLYLSRMSLPLSAMFNAEEGFPPGLSFFSAKDAACSTLSVLSSRRMRCALLIIRFLRGHEALHYGGSELPEPLERLAPPTICMASTGDLGIDFKTSVDR